MKLSLFGAGIAVIRGEGFHLALRTGFPPEGPRGHLHSDVLSYELWVGGREVVVDPGCCLYTGDIEGRAFQRGVGNHPVPVLGGSEQGEYDPSRPFTYTPTAKSRVVDVVEGGETILAVEAEYGPLRVTRRFTVSEGRAAVEDRVESKKPGRLEERLWTPLDLSGSGEGALEADGVRLEYTARFRLELSGASRCRGYDRPEPVRLLTFSADMERRTTFLAEFTFG